VRSSTPRHALRRVLSTAGVAIVLIGWLATQAAAASLPGAPTVTSLTPTAKAIEVAFAAPSSNGGASITGYQASCASSNGGASAVSKFSLKSPLTIKDVTGGKTYTCTVVARNAVGVGPSSALSSSVMVPGVPEPPVITNIDPGRGTLTITYMIGSDNGEPITGVRATCVPAGTGGKKHSKLTLTDPIVVKVKPKGGIYTCTVVARNVVGLSSPSVPFTGDGEPGLITDLSAASNQNLHTTLAFTPPADNGDPIQKYAVKVDGVLQSTPLAGDHTAPLPQNGQSYSVQIAPCNHHCGPWSNVATATPDAAPTPPILSSSVSGGNVFNFSWGSPTSNGCSLSQMGWSVDAPSGPWNFVTLGPGETALNGAFGQSHTLYMIVQDTCGLSAVASITASSVLAYTYSNYGAATQGIPMCRGNPGFPNSDPGGSFSETMSVPAAVGTIDHVMIQIDPDSRVTATLTLYVNGTPEAQTSAVAAGDTQFSVPDVAVTPGDSVVVHVSFTATFGQIITVYEAGSPGGSFSVQNSCPNDPNESFTTGATGLRATVSGWS